VGFVRGGFDLLGFDMGGCFPCFGSSNKEDSGGVRVKEVPNKDSSFKEAASLAPQSHHPSRANTGLAPNFATFLLRLLLPSLIEPLLPWLPFNCPQFPLLCAFSWLFCPCSSIQVIGCFDLVHPRLCFYWCGQ